MNVLFDPGQALAVRFAIRMDSSAAIPAGISILTPFDVPTITDFTLTNVHASQGVFADPGPGSSEGPMTPASVPSLVPGATVVFTGSTTVGLPNSTARSLRAAVTTRPTLDQIGGP